MGQVIGGAAISLDGFINDRHGDVGRLYPDMAAMHAAAWLQESVRNMGAVVMGRRAFEMGDPDWYVDNYEYQVPIFVVSHTPPARPPKMSDRLTFTFVTGGVASAVAQAQAAAGDRDVTVVGGASTFQQCLNAGLLDELHLDIRPVLLGEGQRLLANIANGAALQFEPLAASLAAGGAFLKFRVGRGGA